MKKKNLLVILFAIAVILAVVLVIILNMFRTQTEYQNQMSLGEKYLAQLDYDNAELCYRKALDIKEKEIKPYMQLSNVYVGKQDYEAAYSILGQAQKITEKYSLADEAELVLVQIRYVDEMKKQSDDAKLSGDIENDIGSGETVQEENETVITQLIDYMDQPLSQIWDTFGTNCTYGNFLYYGGTRPIYYEGVTGVPLFGISDTAISDPASYTGNEAITFVQYDNSGLGEASQMLVFDKMMSRITYRELLAYDNSLTVAEDIDSGNNACTLRVSYNGNTYYVTYFWTADVDYDTTDSSYVEILKPWEEEDPQAETGVGY